LTSSLTSFIDISAYQHDNGELQNASFESSTEIVGAREGNSVTVTFLAENHLPVKQGRIDIGTPLQYSFVDLTNADALVEEYPVDESTICTSDNFELLQSSI
jgi:hypothetical protein